MNNYFCDDMAGRKTEIKKEIILQKLRERGFRITKQRLIILNVILNQEYSSCKELYYKASSIDSGIGIATVYRMVSVLEEIGVLRRESISKVECDKGEHSYVIELEDHTKYHLSDREWQQVVSEGMKAIGRGDGRKVISIRKGTNEKNSR